MNECKNLVTFGNQFKAMSLQNVFSVRPWVHRYTFSEYKNYIMVCLVGSDFRSIFILSSHFDSNLLLLPFVHVDVVEMCALDEEADDEKSILHI